MKLRVFIVVVLAVMVSITSVAHAQQSRSKDEAAIRAIIVELNEGWSTGNAEPWGRHFTQDADFVAVTGTYYKGREAIEKGHQALFTGRFKDTKQKYDVRSIRFLREDVAVVHCKGSVVPKNQEFPKEGTVLPMMIFTKEKGRWLVSVFQNLSIPPTAAEIKKICEQSYCGKQD